VSKLKKPLLFALALVPVAAVAGILVCLYQMDTLPPELLAQTGELPGGTGTLLWLSALQTVLYALVCGFFGCLLAEKTGLWKPLRLQKKGLLAALIVGLAGGVVLALDHWTFGAYIPGLQEANAASLTLTSILATILYGGIIEEVMMRLFFMTLLAFLLWKIFCGKKEKDAIPTWVFVAANVLSSLVFAAAHLPATRMLFGALTPLILFRCFLLNGCIGLLFGRLYRKWGIQYAMLAHALCHIVGRLIWLVFI